MKLVMLKIFILLMVILNFCNFCYSQAETNWPKTGYSTYFDKDGNTVIIRNASDEYVGRMELTAPASDYHNPTNIETSYVFQNTPSNRNRYIDVNKNGIQDGMADNFDQYDEGSIEYSAPQIPDFRYRVAGNEYSGSGMINSASGNKYVQFSFNSPFSSNPPAFVVGLIQEIPYEQPINLENSTVSFDIKTTGLSNDIPNVLTIEVWAKTYKPGDPNFIPAYYPWRLQNFVGAVYKRPNPPLYNLPSNGIWQTMVFNITDLIHNAYNDVSHWWVPDFSDVIKCNILILQVDTDDDYFRNDFVASGTIYIDNLKLGVESDPIATTALESSISLLSVSSDSSHPSDIYPGDMVTITLQAIEGGDPKLISAHLKVYDDLFQWTYDDGSIELVSTPYTIFDSDLAGQTSQALIGNNSTATYTFSFRIPSTANPGTYYVYAVMTDSATSTVLDTTGPDKSMEDNTSRAFIPAFIVTSHTGTGPVAIFDVISANVAATDTPGIYEATCNLDASASFHIESPPYEIVFYEWDIDNDGVYDLSGTTPYIQFNFEADEIPPFTKKITLRVTDNNDPQQSDTKSFNVLFTGNVTGNITVTATNWNSSSLPNANCLLYDHSYNYMGDAYRRITNSSGQATWNNIPDGIYLCEIYISDNSPFDGLLLRIIDRITVIAGESQTITLTANTPKITSAYAVYADTGLPVGLSDFYVAGTSIKIICSVENSTDITQICSIKTILDRDKTGSIDIDVTESPSQNILPGETKSFYTFVSIPEPRNEATSNSYYYALRLNTAIGTVAHKTDTRDWVSAGVVLQLPNPAIYSTPFIFSGHQWRSLSWRWRAGLDHNNTWLDNDGNLVLRLKDYSGVGGQAVSVKDTFHYGKYTVRLTAPTVATTSPEGGLLAFFFYWEHYINSTNYYLNEIDLELRTMDVYSNNSTPSTLAAFSVHHIDPTTDNKLRTVTYFCPVQDITKEHEYEFHWTKNSVSFYIDGELAIDNEGKPAIVNNESIVNEGSYGVIGLPFGDRIPYHTGRIMMNHWSGSGWAGTPPQNKGDMIGTFSHVSYAPVAQITKVHRSGSYPKLYIKALDSSGTIDIYSSEDVDGEYDKIGDIETISGQTEYEFIDTTSDAISKRYYKLYY